MHYVSCVSGEGGDSGETAVTSTNSISILCTMLCNNIQTYIIMYRC